MPEEEGYWIRLLNRAGGKGVVSMEMIILKKVLDVGEERILFFFFSEGKVVRYILITKRCISVGESRRVSLKH